MHWVDRGPEPEALGPIHSRYTPGWIAYYPNRTRPRPGDSRWQDFSPQLSEVFSSICGYCEEYCDGEVDHFKPKSKFPALVYKWSNWVLACSHCNRTKGDKWPPSGYVDPCAELEPERPENFFSFDTTTGEIVPGAGFSRAEHAIAAQMIDDLQLNDHYHLSIRRDWLLLVSRAFPGRPVKQVEYDGHTLNHLIARDTQLSSITRLFLVEKGFPVQDA